jgi:4-amino-4-deoxy-L-arabinose transferase-like glycosyltransferase
VNRESSLKSRISNPKLQIALVVSLFLVLGVLYSLVTPPLEASDEFDHYPVVQHIQTQGALPVMDPQDPEPWRQEGGQPPLYHLLMAGLTSWIDTSDLEEIRWLNHHAFIGNPGQLGNKNLIIHQPDREAFPWRGTVLAVHVIRLASVVLGAVTVWLVWRVASTLCPHTPWAALLAAALTGFNPMFLFISAAVNNDVLAALIGSILLLLLVEIANLKSQISNGSLLTRYLALAVVLGLGALTKLSLVAMIPLGLVVVLLRSWRQYSESPLGKRLLFAICHLLLVILMVSAISGWWFIRNWRLYGDPTAVNTFMEILGHRAEPLTLEGFLGEFVTFRRTYWGLFGGVNVAAPGPVYVAYDLFSLAALVGLGVRVWRRRKAGIGVWWIPALWVAALFAALLRWVLMYYSFQGRLMFPGIAALSTFLALGIGEWIPHRWRPAMARVAGGVLLVLAVVAPFVSILPAYTYPEPLALADVPVDARVEPVDVGGVARIVGWEVPEQTIQPGDRSAHVEFVVYWEAVAPDDTLYVSFANVLGRGRQPVGQIRARHLAEGMVPSTLWQPGQVWRDRYRVPIEADAAAPSLLRIEVGLYEPESETTLGTVGIGEAKLAPGKDDAATSSLQLLEIELASGIALRGYALSSADLAPGEILTLTLQWEAQQAVSADYQVFVHMLGDTPQQVAQGDGPPLMGDYPTRLWAPGEVITDPHALTVPPDLDPGSYRLVVGMYSLDTLARLARLDGAGDSIEIPTTIDVR